MKEMVLHTRLRNTQNENHQAKDQWVTILFSQNTLTSKGQGLYYNLQETLEGNKYDVTEIAGSRRDLDVSTFSFWK